MSQKDPVTKQIGDNNFEMYPLPPSVSMDLLIDVVSVLSPVVAPILNGIFSGKSDADKEEILEKEIDADLFLDALKSLKPQELKRVKNDLIKGLSQVTHVNGKSIDRAFEALFLGDIGSLLQWLAWGMKVQWGKSLSALGDVLPSQSAKG